MFNVIMGYETIKLKKASIRRLMSHMYLSVDLTERSPVYSYNSNIYLNQNLMNIENFTIITTLPMN